MHRHCTVSVKFKIELVICSSLMMLKVMDLCWLSKWGNQDLNLGPTDYESAALTN